jgi:hypothetical protein
MAFRLLLPLLLLALSFGASCVTPVHAQEWSELFDGAPELITPNKRMSYFQVRLQSVKWMQSPRARAIIAAAEAGEWDAPALPPLVIAWTNRTNGDNSSMSTTGATPSMYVNFVCNSAPNATNYVYASHNGVISVPFMALLGQGYVVVGVDLGADNFSFGKSKFTMLAQLFMPVDLSMCWPQLFPVPAAASASMPQPVQFILPAGSPGASTPPSNWAAMVQVLSMQQRQQQSSVLTSFVSVKPPASPTNAQWKGRSNSPPLRIPASDPHWPGGTNGTLYVGVTATAAAGTGQSDGTFILSPLGSSYCMAQRQLMADADAVQKGAVRSNSSSSARASERARDGGGGASRLRRRRTRRHARSSSGVKQQ